MSLLDLIGLTQILSDGEPVQPTRKKLNFVGADVEDDPANDQTTVTITGGGGGGAVASVFGRVGTVVAVASDYAASLISNDSGVAGATVKAALEALATAITAKLDTAGAGLTQTGTTVNVAAADGSIVVGADSIAVGYGAAPPAIDTAAAAGSAATAARSDHTHSAAASKVSNDSAVTGVSVKEALETLLASGGGGGPEASYVGYSVTAVAAPGTTWGGFASLLTMVDAVQSAIVRSGSDFTFTHAGNYWVAALVNIFANTAYVGFRLRRTSDNAVLLQHFTYPGTAARTAERGLQGMITVAANTTVRLEVVYSGTAPTTWNIPGVAIDGDTARSAAISIVRIGASASGGWITALDTNISQEPNKTFVNGANTWNGVTWTGRNLAAADQFAIVNGTGLVVDHGATSTEWYVTVDTAPVISAKLSDLIPGFVFGQTKVRVLCQFIVNRQTTNSEVAKVAIEKLPFVASQRLVFSACKGYFGGAARGVYQTIWSSAAAEINFWNQTADNQHMIYLPDTLEAKYYGGTSAAPNSDTNTVALVNQNLPLAGMWKYATTTTSGAVTPIGSTAMRAAYKDDLSLSIGAQSQNTSNGFVATFQRLRVEYQH